MAETFLEKAGGWLKAGKEMAGGGMRLVGKVIEPFAALDGLAYGAEGTQQLLHGASLSERFQGALKLGLTVGTAVAAAAVLVGTLPVTAPTAAVVATAAAGAVTGLAVVGWANELAPHIETAGAVALAVGGVLWEEAGYQLNKALGREAEPAPPAAPANDASAKYERMAPATQVAEATTKDMGAKPAVEKPVVADATHTPPQLAAAKAVKPGMVS